jgi:hypothetical protein
MVGTTVDAPPTWKVSVQVPDVGWAVVNVRKSKLWIKFLYFEHQRISRGLI